MAKKGVDQNHNPSKESLLEEFLTETLLLHHGKTVFQPMKKWQTFKSAPSVLLLTGQVGIGKYALGFFLARWLLCQNPNSSPYPAPCSTCGACLKTQAGCHTGLIQILSEEDAGPLKIDQFRALKSSVGFGTFDEDIKVILIPQIERMTSQAANSVLKLLEEPPTGWKFILTTHDATLVLPTLVSRCQSLQLKPLPRAEILKQLMKDGLDHSRSEVCAELSQGSWDKAISLAGEEAWEQRKVIVKFIQEPHATFHSLVDWALQKNSHLQTIVDVLEHLTQDLLIWSAHFPPPPTENYSWKNRDAQAELTFHAKLQVKKPGGLVAARTFWLDRAQRLSESREESLLPVNRKIFIQDLLLPWLGDPLGCPR